MFDEIEERQPNLNNVCFFPHCATILEAFSIISGYHRVSVLGGMLHFLVRELDILGLLPYTCSLTSVMNQPTAETLNKKDKEHQSRWFMQHLGDICRGSGRIPCNNLETISNHLEPS